MKICRFQTADGQPRIGVLLENEIKDLTAAGCASLNDILEAEEPAAHATNLATSAPTVALADATLLAPVERQEVWAAGVTYLRSKKARMDESDFSAQAYDKVYDAPRPEIFFKSVAEKVVKTGASVGIRSDGEWNVPEPELALVINSRGTIVGYTVGNDMSSRDIEGENLLYLPQAKVYKDSASLGPCITLGASEDEVREWTIGVKIERGGKEVFSGETSICQIKRSFSELRDYLFQSQDFPHGAILMTGTGVVPDDDFTLNVNDVVTINISGIGTLSNPIAVV